MYYKYLLPKTRGKVLFISDMNGSMSMIDYILINKKRKNSIHNSEAYNFYSRFITDVAATTVLLSQSFVSA